MSKVEIDKLNELVEVISSVAALDFSKKVENVKGDGTALDTIAVGLNMLSEELEESVVSIDVFEDKNKELEDVVLKMNEFKYALDSSSIVAMTDSKGNITYVNDKFCEISKYPREELIGENQRIVNSGYHSKEFWVDMWRTIGNGEVWSNEIRNRAKDGSIYWVNTTIVPFLNSNGKPYKYMGIRQDITERKLLDQQVLNSIITTQEQDREVFAEDLHEGLAQSLAALMMQVGVIEMKIENLADKDLKNSVAFIKNYIQENIENTRALAANLMPRTMMHYGIEPSLRSYITKIHENGNRYIEFNCNLKNVLEKDVEITIYRTIVALLDKVSRERVVSVNIKISDQPILAVVIEIRCNSGCIDLFSLKYIGFESYQKRIELLGGQMRTQKLRDNKVVLSIRFS